MKNLLLLQLAIATLTAPVFAQSTPAAYEPGVLLEASTLLPPEQMRGPSHRVRNQVATDGYMAHFEIDSDFGTFEAVGVPQALQRVREIDAIRTLVETSKGDLFAEGLKRSIEQPIDAVRNIVRNPVESVKQAPKTVGHFFGNIGSAIGRGVEQVKERNSGDSPQPTAGEVGRNIGNTAKNVAGFGKAKLETAKQLGVDPYSDNPRLQEEMDKVTWAFFAGGLPLRVGAAAASAGVAVAATNMVGIPEDAYGLTEPEISRRDANSLVEMGLRDGDVTAFMVHRNLSVTQRHRLVTSLEALPKTAGRGNIILLANACESSEQADFLANALAILVHRQRTGAADYTVIRAGGRLPAATTAAGTLEVPAPVDYVTWTEDVSHFAARADLATGQKVLVHTGKLSAVTTSGLEAAGWKTAAVGYPGVNGTVR